MTDHHQSCVNKEHLSLAWPKLAFTSILQQKGCRCDSNDLLRKRNVTAEFVLCSWPLSRRRRLEFIAPPWPARHISDVATRRCFPSESSGRSLLLKDLRRVRETLLNDDGTSWAPLIATPQDNLVKGSPSWALTAHMNHANAWVLGVSNPLGAVRQSPSHCVSNVPKVMHRAAQCKHCRCIYAAS